MEPLPRFYYVVFFTLGFAAKNQALTVFLSPFHKSWYTLIHTITHIHRAQLEVWPTGPSKEVHSKRPT